MRAPATRRERRQASVMPPCTARDRHAAPPLSVRWSGRRRSRRSIEHERHEEQPRPPADHQPAGAAACGRARRRATATAARPPASSAPGRSPLSLVLGVGEPARRTMKTSDGPVDDRRTARAPRPRRHHVDRRLDTRPQRELPRPLVHEHARGRRRPAARARRQRRAAASRGWYTRSATTWPGRSSHGSSGSRRLAPHAQRGGVNDEVGAATSSGPPGPGGQRGGRSAPRRVRLTTTTSAAPASARATTDRAAPRRRARHDEAGRLDAVVEPEGVDEASPSVFSPTGAFRPERHGVGGREPPAAGDGWSTKVATSDLCGIVTESPRRPRAALPAGPRRRRAGGTAKARYTPSSPQAANAALCITGESEWRTGQPMMPATRVAPSWFPDRPNPRPPDRHPSRPGPGAMFLMVVLVVGGEGVACRPRRPGRRTARCTAPAGAARRVRVGRRVERGLDRLLARVGDRRRRQAQVEVRVVRRVDGPQRAEGRLGSCL